MDEQPGLSDQYRKSSPWPLFVAFGLALFETGIVMANFLFPIAVGGMLMFVGSIVGILRESEYISDPWKALVAASVVSFVIGGVIWQTTQGSVQLRGTAILIGAGVLLIGGIAGSLWQPEPI
ncbi:hypothetical protein ZOD2009_06999 [Haladaptatus paucihalophilus DX253]|uniref:Cox cluster protein n=1 Tax=Haladaptatus paucihalophilus DX253 TaxID=797209 RepID=E7QRH7_HALPU|nr:MULTISPECIES: hypothetical protein [Haladaptatus]EFW92596.1 hypothetical protein ZOD2009_06999 [Haladaptatus paucihalophilus DX253]ODR79685.1 hypothetical protein BG842_08505 [Haladaptatus sp. W1]SHK18105.1 hypothetical protein SAMN05444342_0860 [Haladaptatus paucihalophilus DX253]